MAILAVNSFQSSNLQKPSKPNYVKITGYGALGLGAASAIAGLNKKIKPHKYLAYAAGILAGFHTVLVEWYHLQRKRNN